MAAWAEQDSGARANLLLLPGVAHGRSAARRRPMGRGSPVSANGRSRSQTLLFRPMGEVEGRKKTLGNRYTWGFLCGTPGEKYTFCIVQHLLGIFIRHFFRFPLHLGLRLRLLLLQLFESCYTQPSFRQVPSRFSAAVALCGFVPAIFPSGSPSIRPSVPP